ncbi:MAG: hypothetical protein GF398_06120 [Chitinivibrionales bacterium]|nr:hypothetical protein [Chitinivibrionales bacterium]
MAKVSKTELIRLQRKLKTDAKIGEHFGITRQAVHQLRKKFGIDSMISKNAERNRTILEMYNSSGKTGTTIARKFKLSVSQTYRIINDASRKKTGKKAASPKRAAAKKKK